jgi:hypothetical protein
MRGRSRFFFILSSCFLAFSSVKAQNLDQLHEGLRLAETLLMRIEQGSPACHSSSCQKNKSATLHKIYRDSQLLSFLGPEFSEQAKTSIQSARKLVRASIKRTDLSSKQPESFADWTKIFERRYAHDIENTISWLAFAAKIESLRASLQYLAQGFKHLESNEKAEFQKLWERGLAQILADQRRIQELSILRDQNRHDGDESTAEKLDAEKLELMKKSRDWFEENETSLITIQRRFFSDLEFSRIIDFVKALNFWSEFFGNPNILSESLAQKSQTIDPSLRTLIRDIQSFNDLEFGVVGLDNFSTMTNPALAAGWEVQVQNRLQSHLESIQFLMDAGQSLLLLSASMALGGSSRLLQFGIFGTASYFQDVEDFKISDALFQPSDRITRLHQLEMFWNSRMQKRHVELKSTQSLLKQKIHELKERINQTEKGELK